MYASARDITERKTMETQLHQLADHDALTGLLNRRRFTEELELALERSRRLGDAGAVLFLDLDGFKFVNDTLGHAAGDALITRVGGLLRRAVRAADTLARMGGDEFAVLLEGCDRDGAVRVAEKLLGTLRRDGLAGTERRGRLSSSIGIALFSGDERDQRGRARRRGRHRDVRGQGRGQGSLRGLRPAAPLPQPARHPRELVGSPGARDRARRLRAARPADRRDLRRRHPGVRAAAAPARRARRPHPAGDVPAQRRAPGPRRADRPLGASSAPSATCTRATPAAAT